jgi:hypothetical protein
VAVDRLDAIRIRIGIEPDQVPWALRALRSAQLDPARDIVYLLERPAGAPALEQGGVSVIMKVCDDAHRLIVQVRRVLRARLGTRWTEFFERDGEVLRIEEERDGVRRVLTASLASPLGDPSTMLTRPTVAPTDVLSPRQRAFLDDCSVVRLRDRPLRLFGPITVRSWTVQLAGFTTRACWWTFDDPDGTGFEAVALASRTRPERAEFVRPVLASALRGLGIDPDGGAAWPEARAAAYWRGPLSV